MAATRREARVEVLTAVAFILPNILGFAVFMLFPILASLFLSMFNWSPLHGAAHFGETATFMGLKNFWSVVGFHSHPGGDLVANDVFFWKFLGNTVFLMLGIPISILGSLLLASLLSRKIKGAPLFITVFFLPSIVAGVATFVLWGVLLNPESGVVNAILGGAGVDVPIRAVASFLDLQDPLLWHMSETWAKPALILMGLWGSIGGYNMVLYLAALQSIPSALYEAADIDGANAFQKFRHVTWPMVSPTTFFIFTMALIRGFQGGFSAAYVMTQGGPAGATTTISYYIYNLAFSRRFEMGYASAVAWVLFIVTFVLALLNWRYGRRRVHGEFGV